MKMQIKSDFNDPVDSILQSENTDEEVAKKWLWSLGALRIFLLKLIKLHN